MRKRESRGRCTEDFLLCCRDTPCASPTSCLPCSHPVTLPLNTLIPIQLRDDVRMDFGGIMLIQISLPKTLRSFLQKRNLQDAAFFFIFFPLLFKLLETFVHVALLVRPLWSENISECSLLADKRHGNFGPVRKVMELRRIFFFFFFLPNKAL